MAKYKLGEICEFYSGTGFPVTYQGKAIGDFPFYKVGDIANNVVAGNVYLSLCNNYISNQDALEIKGTIIPKDTVVFAKIGEALKLNRRALTSCNCLIDNNAMGIAPKRKFLQTGYFFYFMKNLKLQNFAESTTVPSVRKSKLEQIEIETPPLNTQNEVERTLDKISSLITIRQHQLQKLDELIKARFVEMFGNPVANEKGWHIELLKDVCNGIGDGLHGTPEYDEVGTYPFINGNNLTNGTIEITPSTKMVNIETYVNHYIEISDNAILLSINGTLGKLALYNGEKVMLGKSACYCNLRPEINREFVYGVMRTNAFAEFLESNATASTIKNVGLKAIRNFRLIVPPDDLQTKFVAFSRRIDKSKVAVQKSLNEAQLLFDSLMQQYFG